MSHVAPNLNLINVEFSVSLVVKAPSVSTYVTHSSVAYSSSFFDLLSTSDPTIERQDVVDLKINIKSYDKCIILSCS